MPDKTSVNSAKEKYVFVFVELLQYTKADAKQVLRVIAQVA